MKSMLNKSVLLASTMISFGAVAPSAYAQAAEVTKTAATADEIVVTARRVEERLLDVPISITVFNQDQLDKNNVSSAKDIATYTPGLSVNTRYGSDNTNFSIRGFTQEQRTGSTVGAYFADVVAPRGSGASFGGDGAGPGSLFDLQNVQVLKGPQGTLFGRNVPGGAVLLVPQKPTDKLEGYVQGSIGDYALLRQQAVLNVPVTDSVRLRFGIDHMTRDGYLHNIGNIGDGINPGDDLGDVNYTAGRISAAVDLASNLENTTILSYVKSDSNGVIPKTKQTFPGVRASGLSFGDLATAQLAREAGDPWNVSNRLSDSQSASESWQAINTTVWDVSDSLTVKNIVSYAEFRNKINQDLYGNYFVSAAVPYGTETSGNQVGGFAFTHINPVTGYTNAQSTFTEEFQLQGHPGDGRFVWQAGLYAEISDPLGASGVQTSTFTACADAAALQCAAIPGISFGLAPGLQLSSTTFTDYAIYGQASYNITEQLKLTAGYRYTWDEQTADIRMENVALATGNITCQNFTAADFGKTFPNSARAGVCGQHLEKATEAPTYTLGVDYKPTDTTLLYAKYSKAYRAGGLALFSPDTTQQYDAEDIDTYEIGAKGSWGGPIPGNLSVAIFTNEFTNQQLLLGVLCDNTKPPFQNCNPNAAIVNAASSTLDGLELDLSVRPFEGLRVDLGYAYLDTELKEFIVPTFPAASPYNVVTPPQIGHPIPLSIPHKVNLSANYTLPLADEVGKVSFGGTYVWTDEYEATPAADPIRSPDNGKIDAQQVLNLNANWDSILGHPIDASLFVTNVTNEVNYLNINDSSTRGFISGVIAEPRMFGVNVKYHFGS